MPVRFSIEQQSYIQSYGRQGNQSGLCADLSADHTTAACKVEHARYKQEMGEGRTEGEVACTGLRLSRGDSPLPLGQGGRDGIRVLCTTGAQLQVR